MIYKYNLLIKGEKSKCLYGMLTKKRVIKIVIENAPKNLKLSSPSIKRDIIKIVAFETTKAIINDLEDELFSIFVDESRDIYNKE